MCRMLPEILPLSFTVENMCYLFILSVLHVSMSMIRYPLDENAVILAQPARLHHMNGNAQKVILASVIRSSVWYLGLTGLAAAHE